MRMIQRGPWVWTTQNSEKIDGIFFPNASWVWETPLLRVFGKSKVCCSNGRCLCHLVPGSRFTLKSIMTLYTSIHCQKMTAKKYSAIFYCQKCFLYPKIKKSLSQRMCACVYMYTYIHLFIRFQKRSITCNGKSNPFVSTGDFADFWESPTTGKKGEHAPEKATKKWRPDNSLWSFWGWRFVTLWKLKWPPN